MDKKSAPAFSFAGKPRSFDRQTSPGPAAYNNDFKKFFKADSPGVKMTNAKREQDFNTVSPGPGNYDLQKNKNYSSGINVIMTHKPKPENPSIVPGPGAYEPNYQIAKKKMPKWIYKDRTFKKDWIKNIKKGPGPGQYNVSVNFDSTLKNAQRVIFGQSSRLDRRTLTQNTPGPGQYQADHSKQYLQVEKKISFSRDVRSHTSMTKTPGPGQYKIKSDLQDSAQKKKGFHMGIKSRCKTEQKIPGPGAYANLMYNTKMRNSPSFSIQKATRSYFKTQASPSPLQYATNFSSFNRNGGTMPKAKRDQLDKQRIKTPGPGSYNNEETKKRGKQYSFTKSRFFDRNSHTPGPQYDPKPVYQSKYTTIGFGSSKRNGGSQLNRNPGPGDYQNKFLTIETNKSGVSIGRAKRSLQKGQKSPGPGQYNIPSYISNVPSFASSQVFRNK